MVENLYTMLCGEVAENKIELMRLNPDSDSLKYITICNLGGWGKNMTAWLEFTKNLSLREPFEEYTGLSLKPDTSGETMLSMYSEALVREIEGLKERAKSL